MSPYELIKRPVITEKNTMLMEHGQYTFEVAPTATKHEIKEAVEKIFNVKVVSVNTIHVPGKTKIKRRRGIPRGIVGRSKGRKKAVVKLAEGQRIELFEGV